MTRLPSWPAKIRPKRKKAQQLRILQSLPGVMPPRSAMRRREPSFFTPCSVSPRRAIKVAITFTFFPVAFLRVEGDECCRPRPVQVWRLSYSPFKGIAEFKLLGKKNPRVEQLGQAFGRRFPLFRCGSLGRNLRCSIMFLCSPHGAGPFASKPRTSGSN